MWRNGFSSGNATVGNNTNIYSASGGAGIGGGTPDVGDSEFSNGGSAFRAGTKHDYVNFAFPVTFYSNSANTDDYAFTLGGANPPIPGFHTNSFSSSDILGSMEGQVGS